MGTGGPAEQPLAGVIALVAGATRGAGRGIAIELGAAGATVYVDSVDTAPIGTTPMANVRIPKGRHTLIFRLANHEDARLAVNIARRRETFRQTLQPLGRIVVTAGNTPSQPILAAI